MKGPMMRSRAFATVVAGCAVVVAVSGCSPTVPGDAVPDPAALAARLDAGNYSTAPRTVRATDALRIVTAANAVGERLVIPSEVDRKFLVGDSRVLAQDANFVELDEAERAVLWKRGMAYGYLSRATEAGTRSGFGGALIRLADDASAKGAVDDLRAVGHLTPAGAARPGVFLRRLTLDEGKGVRIEAFYAVGPLLVWQTSTMPDESSARAYLDQAIDKQTGLLAGFTSLDEAHVDGLVVDKDGIVSHTVAPKVKAGTVIPEADFYRGRRTQALQTADSAWAAKVYDEAGVDLVGVGANGLFRTANADSARRLRKHFADEFSLSATPGEYTSSPFVVALLPDTDCREYRRTGSKDASLRACFTTVGRYLSVATTRGHQVQAEQLASAAYLVLQGLK